MGPADVEELLSTLPKGSYTVRTHTTCTLRSPLITVGRTLAFAYSFRLWETYVSSILEHKNQIPPDQYLEMRYEDLLATPERELRRVTDFAGHSVGKDVLAAACQRIDRSRLDNSAFAADYRELIPALSASPLLMQLGYNHNQTWE